MRESVAGPFVLMALLLPTSTLCADDLAPSQAKREIRETIGASANNLGLQNVVGLSWTWRLSSSPGPLLRDAHIALGLSHSLTPSYTRVGAWAQISPLSVLDLEVGMEPTAYFGTFQSLMSFDQYDDAFDNKSRAARKGHAGFGTAWRVYASPTLKMKLGPLIALASADFEWWRSGAPGPLFYEPARDTLLKASGDRLVATSSLLLHQQEVASGGTLAFGVTHNLTYVYAAPENRIQRLGAVAIRQFAEKRFGRQAPRIAGQVYYYLNDRFKKGQVGAALSISFRLGR